MRSNECSFPVIRARYHIGTSTIQLILKRFEASGLTLEELRLADPRAVEELFYPPEQVRRKDVPLPDFQYYYDRIHAKGSKINIAYCWIEYKTEHPDGYELKVQIPGVAKGDVDLHMEGKTRCNNGCRKSTRRKDVYRLGRRSAVPTS